MNGFELKRRFFPEVNVGGFSYLDGRVAMFSQIDAVLKPSDRVLDFGAGRGEPIIDDSVEYRRRLTNLQGRCAHVEGCDVDGAVLDNPFLDHAEIIATGSRLPYEDESFDLIFSRFVFEHIEDPQWMANEMLRILRPGGLIVATTPSKYSYIALAARSVPNGSHVNALTYIQPDRKADDVFPVFYRLNTTRALRRTFEPGARVFVTRLSGEPGYHFGRPSVYSLMKFVNKHLPEFLQPLLIVYIRKNERD